MTPTLLLATSTLGLLPLLLRGDLPASMGPFELLLDTSLRMLALLLGLLLVGYVILMEIEGDPWNDLAVGRAALLALWTLLALGIEFALVARHRLSRALAGTRLPTDRFVPPAAGATNWVFVMNAVMVLVVAAGLLGLALGARVSGSAAVATDAASGGLMVIVLVPLVSASTLRMYTIGEQRVPFAGSLARILDGSRGSWVTLALAAPASPDVEPEVFSVWEADGAWLWPLAEVRRLIRYRRVCVAAARRPCLGLHCRRLTVRGTPGPRRRWSTCGVRVWDSTQFRWTRGFGAHRAEAFEPGDMVTVPGAARGKLAPLDAGMLKEAGLVVTHRRAA